MEELKPSKDGYRVFDSDPEKKKEQIETLKKYGPEMMFYIFSIIDWRGEPNDKIKEYNGNVERIEKFMTELLGDKKFIGGDQPDIVDICLMSVPQRAALWKETDFKDLYDYYELDKKWVRTLQYVKDTESFEPFKHGLFNKTYQTRQLNQQRHKPAGDKVKHNFNVL